MTIFFRSVVLHLIGCDGVFVVGVAGVVVVVVCWHCPGMLSYHNGCPFSAVACEFACRCDCIGPVVQIGTEVATSLRVASLFMVVAMHTFRSQQVGLVRAS